MEDNDKRARVQPSSSSVQLDSLGVRCFPIVDAFLWRIRFYIMHRGVERWCPPHRRTAQATTEAPISNPHQAGEAPPRQRSRTHMYRQKHRSRTQARQTAPMQKRSRSQVLTRHREAPSTQAARAPAIRSSQHTQIHNQETTRSPSDTNPDTRHSILRSPKAPASQRSLHKLKSVIHTA